MHEMSLWPSLQSVFLYTNNGRCKSFAHFSDTSKIPHYAHSQNAIHTIALDAFYILNARWLKSRATLQLAAHRQTPSNFERCKGRCLICVANTAVNRALLFPPTWFLLQAALQCAMRVCGLSIQCRLLPVDTHTHTCTFAQQGPEATEYWRNVNPVCYYRPETNSDHNRFSMSGGRRRCNKFLL